MEALNDLTGVFISTMKFFQRAMLASPRALGLLMLAVLGALLPTSAYAMEGANVRLQLSQNDKLWLIGSFILGILALIYGLVYLRGWVMRQSPGSESMQSVGLAIREGALAYLRRQMKMMSIFILVLVAGLVALYWGQMGPNTAIWVGVCFVAGVSASYIAGYAGMLMAVNGNMRTANAALTSYKRSLEVAFRSGAVAGMVTVGIGLVGASLILYFFPDRAVTLLVGFGFGGSLAALFMRVGGGIFTKAADVGADLVGKVEAGIPEDDPRNPATIADNVGDNVGDCAGMAADIFESYEVTLVAAIVLGAATAAVFDTATWTKLVLFALAARGVGIIASMIGIQAVRGSDDLNADPLTAIRKGFYSSAAIAGVFTLLLAYFMMGGSGNPIRTTQLVTPEDIRQREVREIVAARSRLAEEKNVAPWKITAKELAALPELQDVGEEQPAGMPGLSEEQRREQAIQLALGQAAQEESSGVPGQKPLTGFTPLQDLPPDHPVMNYTIQKVPKSKAEADTLQTEPDTANRFSTVGEQLKAGNLDLVIVKVEQTLPAPPQQDENAPKPEPQTETFYAGPVNRSWAEEQQKNPQSPDTKFSEFIPATIYANSAGDLAVAADVPLNEIERLRPMGPFGSVVKASLDDVREFIKNMQTNPGSPPPIGTIRVAAVEGKTVPWWTFAVAVLFGLVMAFAIEALTDYYVSTHKKPTQEVAGVSSAGPAPMIIQGFAYALESSVFMVFSIVVALLVPLFIFPPGEYGGYILSFYGIALVGLGLLTTTGYVLAMDTFGPISDNAQGVFEMSGAGHGNEAGSKAVQHLDAAGNTTKALTKGFAIATAVVAAVALFHSYLEGAQLGELGLRLDIPEIFLGLLIGGAAPYLFSAFAINAVGRSSFELINEVRRQFRNDPGILAGTSKPDYARCVSIVTAAAQKELLGPGILAIALPIAVGFGFSIGKDPQIINGQAFNLTGAQALGGFLAGAILSGQLMAVLLANSGGTWDNAKKLIEDGLYGGKGTDAHKAGVVCDTVGDPFKDTAGPALNPLIKVMNLVALLLAAVIIQPFSDLTLAIITGTAVLALAISIFFSKRGSLSTALQAAASEGADADKHFSSADPAITGQSAPDQLPKKRRITVDEEVAEEVANPEDPPQS